MIASTRRLAFSSALMLCIATPSFAQGNADFFGAFESIIRLSQQQQQEKRQQEIAIKRLQMGLGRLGFYRDQIDGNLGPGTMEAISSYYISIGKNPPRELSMEDVEFVEAQARQVETPVPASNPVGEGVASYNPISTAGPERNLKIVQNGAQLKLKHTGQAVWIVAASGSDLENVLEVARSFSKDFWSTSVVRSGNGRYAVLLGWMPKESAIELKDVLQSQSVIPSDAYLATGERFGQPVWSADAVNIKSRSDLLRFSLVRPAPTVLNVLANLQSPKSVTNFVAQVSGLADFSSGYLSLRKQPSLKSEEIRKMPEGTALQIVSTRGEWHQVNLLNGMTGWASAKYVQTVPRIDNQEDEDINEDVAGNDSSGAVDQVLRDKIIGDARIFRDDVDAFLKQSADTPDIVEIAQDVALLQTALNTSDIPGIQGSMSSLKSRLLPRTEFSKFVAEREKERSIAEIKALGEAVSIAKRNNFFLTRFVSQNITSPSIPKLLPLLNEYKNAMNNPTLDRLVELNSRLYATVNSENLRDKFEQIASGYIEEAVQEKSEAGLPPADNKISVTEKNKVIFEGDGKELVMLFNADSAPNVIKNLRGDIVFEKGNAVVCYLHAKPEKVLDGAVVELLASFGAKNAQPISGPCNEAELQKNDVVLGIRSEILLKKLDYIYPLLSLMEKGSFQILKVVSRQELASLTDEDGTMARSIEQGIDKGTTQGFGLVKTGNSSNAICSTAVVDVEGHVYSLEQEREKVETFLEKFTVVQSNSLDEAFSSIKRGRCGALYGDARDLSQLLVGMRRDGLHYKVIPIWFNDAQIASAQSLALAMKQTASQVEAEKKLAIEEQEKLEKNRASDLASTKAAREAALQTQYGALARARADEIVGQFEQMTDGQDTWFATSFPRTTDWYSNQKADGWEFVDVKYEIADFGTSTWKERVLPTTFVNLNVSMKNRLLGENKTFCFNTGVIFDDEFGTLREPSEAPCDSADEAMRKWKLGWAFNSQWLVAN